MKGKIMKKFSLVLAATLMGVSLNAATLAVVDGKDITTKDVNGFFAPILQGKSISDLSPAEKKEAINQYITKVLIVKDARADKLQDTKLFKESVERAKTEILMNLYQKKYFDSAKVPESEVKAFYDKNKEKYKRPAQVEARHILVESLAKAKQIIADLKGLKGKALEKKFEELAKKYSVDKGSAAQGGELGWFGQSAMVKPFADAAFSMKVGTVSKVPVKSTFGYHIIYKQAQKPAGVIPFKDVKKELAANLKLKAASANMMKRLNELRAKAKIEYK